MPGTRLGRNTLQFKKSVIFCAVYSLENNSFAIQLWLFQNTATNTNFSLIFSTYRLNPCHCSILFSLLDYLTNYHSYIKNKSKQSARQFEEEEKRGTQRTINYSKLSLWKDHLKCWDGTSIPPNSTRLPTRNLWSKRGRITWIIYQRSLLGTSWRTVHLKFFG